MTKRIGLKFFHVPGTKQHHGRLASEAAFSPQVSLWVAETPAAGEPEMSSETLPRTQLHTPARANSSPGTPFLHAPTALPRVPLAHTVAHPA